MLHRLSASIRTGSYAVLLAALLAALVIAPFAKEQVWIRWLVGITLLGVTVSALAASWRRQGGRTFVIALTLGVLSVVADLIHRSGVDAAMHVDGCPPPPMAILDALLGLLESTTTRNGAMKSGEIK